MVVEVEGRCDLCVGTGIELGAWASEVLLELFFGVVVKRQLSWVWLGGWARLGGGCSVHGGGVGKILGDAREVRL